MSCCANARSANFKEHSLLLMSYDLEHQGASFFQDRFLVKIARIFDRSLSEGLFKIRFAIQSSKSDVLFALFI